MNSLYASTVQYHLAPLLPLLQNPKITEILVNGPDRVYVEMQGRIVRAKDIAFAGEDELWAACTNIAQYSGKIFDKDHVRFDGRLPDGCRVHVIAPPVARFIAISIRKFSSTALTPDDLVRLGSMSLDAGRYLKAAIRMKRNIIVSGGTGSGKTTILAALATFIPEHERIVLIEDTGELKLTNPHVVQLEARAPDHEGRGAVNIRDLLHSTLRLRPDRIILGEVRGGEAMDLLNALNSGHGGTMCTLHANSALGALAKLETLVLFAGEDMPIKVIRAQVANAVETVVQISRFPDGSRRLETITEIEPGLDEHGSYRTHPLFRFKGEGIKDGRLQGELQPCGNMPIFTEESIGKGVPMERAWFGLKN